PRQDRPRSAHGSGRSAEGVDVGRGGAGQAEADLQRTESGIALGVLPAPGTRPLALGTLAVPGLGDAVEVALPDDEVYPARLDGGVLHAEAGRVLGHRVPAEVGVLEVVLGVQAEELELIVAQPEQFPPAVTLHAEPALLANGAGSVARHVHALGARVGDEAFEPVAVAHEAVP